MLPAQGARVKAKSGTSGAGELWLCRGRGTMPAVKYNPTFWSGPQLNNVCGMTYII